ncbi:MAG: hypothetical protein DSZ21_02765 [Tenericutes bacterium]|nr:MAG: hypothetical protein DSZ21_02765 [Mycoplasmatota bacterium]
MNKKILLSIGSLAAITAPVAAVVACGFSSDPSELTAQEKIDAAIKGLSKEDFLNALAGKITNNKIPTNKNVADTLNSLDGISHVGNENIEITVVPDLVSVTGGTGGATGTETDAAITLKNDEKPALTITIKNGETILNTFRISGNDLTQATSNK